LSLISFIGGEVNQQSKRKRVLTGMALLIALAHTPLWAATIRVGGQCLLSEAITAANTDRPFRGCRRGRAADRIILPANSVHRPTRINNRVYGPTALPVIRSNITLIGRNSTIGPMPSGPIARVFAVGPTGNFRVENVTITGGESTTGAGVFVANGGDRRIGGRLVLLNSRVTGNTGCGIDAGSASDYGYGDPFALVFVGNSIISRNTGCGLAFGYGEGTIVNSTISDNQGIGAVAGVFNGDIRIFRSLISGNKGGGLATGYKASNLTIVNCTISGNSSSSAGGGVYAGDQSDALISNSTITGNSAQVGGGLYVGYLGGANLEGTIITGNVAPQGREAFRSEEAFSVDAAKFNLFGHSGDAGVVGFAPGASDVMPAESLDQILNTTLRLNGGPTATHALVPNSPAIDMGSNGACLPIRTDQRLVTRPRDGNLDGASVCDIGAFEYVPPRGAAPPPPPAVQEPPSSELPASGSSPEETPSSSEQQSP
jgi:hypothetical protein